jgi:transcriptional regulator with XRE-family HTH domain
MAKRRNGTPKEHTLTDVLKEAIQASGLTISALAERAEVPVPSISLFLRGKRSLSVPVAEKLMGVLGLRVVPTSANPDIVTGRSVPEADKDTESKPRKNRKPK